MIATTRPRLQAVVTSPAPPSAWEACYAADPTALPTQAPGWVRAMEATGAWRDASRHYRFDDGAELVLPAVRHRGSRSPVSWSSMPDAWGFGGAFGADIDAAHLRPIIEDLRRARVAWTRIRPNPLHADAWAEAASEATGSGQLVAIPKRAHVLTLDRPADALFADRFTSACRRAIRSAERAGLEVEVGSSPDLCRVFHGLLMTSVERWAGAQHEPLALAQWRANRRDPLAKFEAWSHHLGSACRILVARRQGTPIAAMVVLQGHNAHMTRAAMDRDLVGNDRPNELLMWHAIRGAVDAGCASFHLGESGTSANLSRYKEKYGAVGLPYAEHRIERLPGTSVDRALRGVVKRLVRFEE